MCCTGILALAAMERKIAGWTMNARPRFTLPLKVDGRFNQRKGQSVGPGFLGVFAACFDFLRHSFVRALGAGIEFVDLKPSLALDHDRVGLGS